MAKKKEYITVHTPFGRVSFPNLSKPKERNPDIPKDRDYGVGKYSVGLLIPKQDEDLEKDKGIKPILDAMKKVHKAEFADTPMTDHHFPIIDGKEDYANYLERCKGAGNEPSEQMKNLEKYWRINASTNAKFAPSIANPLGKPMTAEQIEEYIEEDINCWCRMSIEVATYNLNKQARGITFYLKGVQYKEDSSKGENPISSASTESFGAVEGADDWESTSTKASEETDEDYFG